MSMMEMKRTDLGELSELYIDGQNGFYRFIY